MRVIRVRSEAILQLICHEIRCVNSDQLKCVSFLTSLFPQVYCKNRFSNSQVLSWTFGQFFAPAPLQTENVKGSCWFWIQSAQPDMVSVLVRVPPFCHFSHVFVIWGFFSVFRPTHLHFLISFLCSFKQILYQEYLVLIFSQHLGAGPAIPYRHPVADATQPKHSSAPLFNFFTLALHSTDVPA